MSVESEVKDCLHYFDLVYFATHKKELPKYFAAEGAFVAGGKVYTEKIKADLKSASAVAKKEAEEATKAAEKAQAKLASVVEKQAAKEAEVEAAKKAAQKAVFFVSARKAEVEVLEKSAKALGKEAVELTAKTAAKETAKVTAEAAAKSAAKKIPFVSLAVGGFFGAIRVGSGIYNFVQGNTTRGLEELGKAGVEVTSGAVACIPVVGTAASLGIDAALLGWDVGDAIHDAYSAEGDAKADAPAAILLKYKVLQISEAINNKRYSIAAFLNDVFEITFANLKCHTDEEEAAKDAAYIYAMVKNVFDNKYFAGKFPTETIAQKMAEKGFSTCQVDCFRALANADGRK